LTIIFTAGYLTHLPGVYFSPDADSIQAYRDYVESLPFSDEPEIFGMHDNANIAFQVSTYKMESIDM